MQAPRLKAHLILIAASAFLHLCLCACSAMISAAVPGPVRVAIVTGANKGIGFEIARKIGMTAGFKCILTARNAQAGSEAARQLLEEGANVEFEQLDIDNTASIQDFTSRIRERYGRVHVLVNNAAIAFKGSDPTPFMLQTEPTFRTNFWATVEVTETLLPLLRNQEGPGSSRIVFVASMAGHLRILKDTAKREFVSRDDLTREDLFRFVNQFIQDVKEGVHTSNNWPSSNYGMSKLSVIAFSRILAREEADNGIAVNSCCPGYCSTDMSSHMGPKTAEEGARTPALLATMPDPVTGTFWSEERPESW